MQRPYREHHILKLMQAYDQQNLPLDLLMSQYFRANKALGPKDRAEIAEAAYGMMRWQGLLDHLSEKPVSWEKRYHLYAHFHPRNYLARERIPWNVRLSFPKALYERILNSHGEEKGHEICLTCNSPAPTTVRANSLKIDRESLLLRWKAAGFAVSPTPYSSNGIVFFKRVSFFSLPEFKEGLFEVQDEGSQLVADLVKAEPGQLVMDYCAGSGGKTLAFAPKMQNKGQIFLHDVRHGALIDCRKRLRRAGIQNAQVIPAEDAKLKKLKKGMDWVLVDAPCSGTGTLRRNPDMKWKYSDEMLMRLVGQQRMIFEKALSYLSPKGRIVYATCSLLREENQEQTEHFIKTYGLQVEGDPFFSLPSDGGMDGFYGVVLSKKSTL